MTVIVDNKKFTVIFIGKRVTSAIDWSTGKWILLSNKKIK